jgi:hypothetical protein
LGAVRGAISGLGSAVTAPISALGGLVNVLGKVGLAGLGIQALSGAVQGLGSTLGVGLASDMNESLNKMRVVFGESSAEVEAFGATAARSLGMSRLAAISAAGTFGNLFTTLGLSKKAAAGMSTDVIKLASDLASFHNVDPSDVLEKLRSGLVGESEPLRALGINLTEAGVAAEAVRLGLAKTTEEVSDAAKVQARYSLILQQSKNASGDFANTSIGMANAMRIISASVEDAKIAIGERLLPVVAPLIAAFASSLPRALNTLKGGLDQISSVIGTGGGVLDGLRQIGGFFQEVTDRFARLTGGDVRMFFIQLGHIVADLGFRLGKDWVPVLNTLRSVGEAIQQYGPTIRDVFRNLVANIRDLMATGDVNSFLVGMAGTISRLGDELGFDWKPIVAGMYQVRDAAIEIIAKAKEIGSNLSTAFSYLLKGGDIGAFAEAVRANLGPVVEAITTWISDTALPAIRTQLATWRDAFVAWVEPMIPPLLEKTQKIADAVVTWARDTALPAITRQVSAWGEAFYTWIQPNVRIALQYLREWADKVAAWLLNDAPGVIEEGITSFGLAFTKWVNSADATVTADGAGTLLTKLFDWTVNTAVPYMLTLGVRMGGAIVRGLVAGFGGLAEQLGAAIAAELRRIYIRVGVLVMKGGELSIDTSAFGVGVGITPPVAPATGPMIGNSSQSSGFNWSGNIIIQGNASTSDVRAGVLSAARSLGLGVA